MPSVAAIILAAGASRRMGQPKQLLAWAGEPLIRVVARAAIASQAAPVYVVVGGAGEQVATALAGLPVTLVENDDYTSGQSSSLRLGIGALGTEVGAAIVLLGDQPFVTPAIIDRLIAAWQQQPMTIVAPTFDGQRGNPVLFDRSVFNELLAVEGDQGARTLLQADPGRVQLVAFADARPLLDIDTAEDYARARQQADLLGLTIDD